MTCQACQARASNQHSGLYQFKCLECCAHLLASADPEIERAHCFWDLIKMTMKNDARDKKEVWKIAKQIVKNRKK